MPQRVNWPETARNAQTPSNNEQFELRANDDSIKVPAPNQDETLFKGDDDDATASVVVQTPSSPDIVFLDDTHIESMDLINDFMNPTNNGWGNLKRIESEG